MPISREAQTRIDALRDQIAQVQARHAARVGTPNDQALFVKHPNGAVYDRAGNEMRGPLPKSLVVVQ